MRKGRENICVDILMATYNGGKYLSEQINSILQQSHKNFRLIISDDVSNDETWSLIESYKKRDKRIISIRNTFNIGVIKNFESLIMQSDSPYFMLCDQDDIWHKHKIEKSLEKITLGDALLVYSDLRVVNATLNTIHSSYWRKRGITPVNDSDAWKVLLVENFVTGCTIIAKNELLEYALPFPDNVYMHDWWLAYAASISGEIDYIDEALIDYRQHGDNLIGLSSSEMKFNQYSFAGGFKSYYIFLENRCKDIECSISMLEDWARHNGKNKFENHEVKQNIYKYCNWLYKFKKTKFIGFLGFRGFMCRRRFASLNLRRNLWKIIYFDFPIAAYVLIIFIKLLNDRRN